MNNILVGVLVTGAVVAAGYAAYKIIKSKNAEPDYDDDIYDYPDPYDTDESIDFEINDSTVKEFAEDAAEKAEDIAEEVADKAEDAADAVKDAVEDGVEDTANDATEDVTADDANTEETSGSNAENPSQLYSVDIYDN